MAGLQVIRPHERDRATTQTPGMIREAGVSEKTSAATGIWSGYVLTPPATV